ncbi:hypothetical protein BOTBODRAFT_181554 [Botryobasidium botryosum FD-172 SS1]|uniref:Uncharacterized protein n=1 Tax=Botryobasidium botryosum (strain FD-172 SS1) TaxID=930990 RepID=A0A067LW23_BOTB1|nr:hypothetical protein BOTBODRAFT_181554 [Botryobasidium botryosum FD-172 SS1]
MRGTQLGVLPENDKVEEWKKAFVKAEADIMARLKKRLCGSYSRGLGYFGIKQAVVNAIDVPIVLRLPQDVLQRRRLHRVYDLPDGTIWKAPPGYWEQVSYPAYKRVHQHLYVDGDVENGDLSGEVDGLLLLEPEGVSMTRLLDASCQKAMDTLRHMFPPQQL